MYSMVNHDLGELYKTQYRRVFSLCRYLLNSSDAAEDATHEVFLRAQRGIDGYDRSRPLASWLLSIAGHYCVDILRRRSVEARMFEPDESGYFEPASAQDGPLGEVLAAERGDAVRAAISALPAKYRLPLVLKYGNDLSYDEIASVLGVGRNQVATLIFRAKRELRRILKPGKHQEKSNGLSF
jgi:RNA polymerase sigma-70 factor (ECF subfamily)